MKDLAISILWYIIHHLVPHFTLLIRTMFIRTILRLQILYLFTL